MQKSLGYAVSYNVPGGIYSPNYVAAVVLKKGLQTIFCHKPGCTNLDLRRAFPASCSICCHLQYGTCFTYCCCYHNERVAVAPYDINAPYYSNKTT